MATKTQLTHRAVVRKLELEQESLANLIKVYFPLPGEEFNAYDYPEQFEFPQSQTVTDILELLDKYSQNVQKLAALHNTIGTSEAIG